MLENRFSSVSYPEELRKLSQVELPDFAGWLRKEIIHALSEGEGHLGSSLGLSLIHISEPTRPY